MGNGRGSPGHIPGGGTINQILTKLSSNPYDVDWEDAPAGGGSGAIKQVIVPIAYNTAGLVIPASGPAGIKLCDLVAGEAVLGECSFLHITTTWNGTTPQMEFVSTANRGNMPGTPPPPGVVFGYPLTADNNSLFSDSTHLRTNSAMAASFYTAVAWAATSLYAYVHDGAFGDPGSTQGAGEIRLFIAAAS